MYFAIVGAVNLLRLHVFNTYGFISPEDRYFYYSSDLVLSVLLYFVLASLCREVFPAKSAHLHVRIGSALIAAGVGIFSFAILPTASSRLISWWIFEYSENLYFVGALGALILFGVATYKSKYYRARAPTLLRVCRLLPFFLH
jgi:hypothetical protein